MSRKLIKFSKQHFAEEVEKIAGGDVTYLDAIQKVCEDNEIDLESAGNYISGALREKINYEAIRLRLLKKSEMESIESTMQLPI
jgi:hypothetical protein